MYLPLEFGTRQCALSDTTSSFDLCPKNLSLVDSVEPHRIESSQTSPMVCVSSLALLAQTSAVGHTLIMILLYLYFCI